MDGKSSILTYHNLDGVYSVDRRQAEIHMSQASN